MCGIAGIMAFDDQPVDRDRLSAMLVQVAHRGPDDQDIQIAGRCGLAHARLAVIDGQGGKQPMLLDADGRHLHVIFNGEIYNHRALRRELEQSGHAFKSSHSDTEVLLHGFVRWGTNLPDRLEGMFAFAIWDDTRRALFLARDRAGKKPLYIQRRAGELAFGSLAATLVAGRPKGESPAINREALGTYLQLGYTFEPSMIAGIEELPAGCAMLVESDGRSTTEPYWSPPEPGETVGDGPPPIDRLRESVTLAVDQRLAADVPLGAFLSGGIDSSIVAALAQKTLTAQGAPPLMTFNVAMDDDRYDETPHAQTVARHIGAQHTVLHASPGDVMADLTHLMAVAGEPTADSSLLPQYWLCKAVRQRVTVALSGDGGDELFGGYDRYRAIAMLGRYGRWLAMLPATTSLEQKSKLAKLGRLVNAARASRDPAQQFLRMIHLFNADQLTALAPDLCASDNTAHLPWTGLPDWPVSTDARRSAMRWDRTHYLTHEVLRKVDRASMAVALEVRCPLLDRGVIELAHGLPIQTLVPGGRPKALLRQFGATLLPESIARRPKAGFALPIGNWLRGKLRDAVADRLQAASFDRLWIDGRVVRQLFEEHAQAKADHTHRLFALLQLALWLEWIDSRR